MKSPLRRCFARRYRSGIKVCGLVECLTPQSNLVLELITGEGIERAVDVSVSRPPRNRRKAVAIQCFDRFLTDVPPNVTKIKLTDSSGNSQFVVVTG